MNRAFLSSLTGDDHSKVVRLLEALRPCAGLSLHVRSQVAAMVLMPAQELREEIDLALRHAAEHNEEVSP